MAQGISIIGVLVLILLLALIVGGAVALVLLLKRRGGAAGQSGTCGKCGYRVTGLTTFNCPECGSDLREVGIVKLAGGSGGLWALVIGGGVAVLLVCMCLSVGMFGWVRSSRAPVRVMPAPVTAPANAAPPAEDVAVPAEAEPGEGEVLNDPRPGTPDWPDQSPDKEN